MAQTDCPNCGGRGTLSRSMLHPTNPNFDSWESYTCPACHGTKKIGVPEPTYEYRVFEKQYGKRMPFRDHPQPTTDVLKTAKAWRRGADFIPKSGSWHIERREVGEWAEL